MLELQLSSHVNYETSQTNSKRLADLEHQIASAVEAADVQRQRADEQQRQKCARDDELMKMVTQLNEVHRFPVIEVRIKGD
jgi:hypothetical protein